MLPPLTVPATRALKLVAPVPKSRFLTWIQPLEVMPVTFIPPSEQGWVCIPDSLAIITVRRVKKGFWFFRAATPAVVGATKAMVPSVLKVTRSKFTLRWKTAFPPQVNPFNRAKARLW